MFVHECGRLRYFLTFPRANATATTLATLSTFWRETPDSIRDDRTLSYNDSSPWLAVRSDLDFQILYKPTTAAINSMADLPIVNPIFNSSAHANSPATPAVVPTSRPAKTSSITASPHSAKTIDSSGKHLSTTSCIIVLNSVLSIKRFLEFRFQSNAAIRFVEMSNNGAELPD